MAAHSRVPATLDPGSTVRCSLLEARSQLCASIAGGGGGDYNYPPRLGQALG